MPSPLTSKPKWDTIKTSIWPVLGITGNSAFGTENTNREAAGVNHPSLLILGPAADARRCRRDLPPRSRGGAVKF